MALKDYSIHIFVSLIIICATAPATAHHSFVAEFDIKQPIRLRGKVTRMVLSNPHSWIYLSVTTEKGEVQEWAIEGAAPNSLIRRGWNRNSLPVGTEISVLGYRARDGSKRASGALVTLPDGTKLPMASKGVGAPRAE